MKLIERIKDFILRKFWYHYPKSIKYVTTESFDEFKELVQHLHNIEDRCPLRVTQDVRGNFQIWLLTEKMSLLGFYMKDAKVVALYNWRLKETRYSLEFLKIMSKENYLIKD